MIYPMLAVVVFFVSMFIFIKYFKFSKENDVTQFFWAAMTFGMSLLWPFTLPLALFGGVSYYIIEFMKKKWGGDEDI